MVQAAFVSQCCCLADLTCPAPSAGESGIKKDDSNANSVNNSQHGPAIAGDKKDKEDKEEERPGVSKRKWVQCGP